jgi:hypothetical protein
MAKIDKLKEEIGWLKIIFGVLIATDISLVVWLVQNKSNSASSYSLCYSDTSSYICNCLGK